jgi:hypothetical protein
VSEITCLGISGNTARTESIYDEEYGQSAYDDRGTESAGHTISGVTFFGLNPRIFASPDAFEASEDPPIATI